MASRLSLEFLSWLLESNNNDISAWYMLDSGKVPEKFKKIIWPILDELEQDGLATGIRKYGQSDKQQCDFNLTPLALDATEEYRGHIKAEPAASASPNGTTNVININAPISNSNISSGSCAKQNNIQSTSEGNAKTWFEKYWFPLLLALIGVAGTIIAAWLWH